MIVRVIVRVVVVDNSVVFSIDTMIIDMSN